MFNMKKYIADRSKQMKNKILSKARENLIHEDIHIFWENSQWWIKVFIGLLDNGELDVVDYNVVEDENGNIDFEVR